MARLPLAAEALSKLFYSRVGKRSNSFRIRVFGAGTEGTSEKFCQLAGPHSAWSWKETQA